LILLLSASWVSRIIGLSQQHLILLVFSWRNMWILSLVFQKPKITERHCYHLLRLRLSQVRWYISVIPEPGSQRQEDRSRSAWAT
jgi:hypothetical protein